MYSKNKILYWSPKILAILFGLFFIIFGGYDDSPGAQLIGLILIVIAVVFLIKGRKNNDTL